MCSSDVQSSNATKQVLCSYRRLQPSATATTRLCPILPLLRLSHNWWAQRVELAIWPRMLQRLWSRFCSLHLRVQAASRRYRRLLSSVQLLQHQLLWHQPNQGQTRQQEHSQSRSSRLPKQQPSRRTSPSRQAQRCNSQLAAQLPCPLR